MIDSCQQASRFIASRSGDTADVVLLVPTGDPIIEEFGNRIDIFEGSEFDVLDRYTAAVAERAPDAVVRVTGDCPLSMSYVIDGIVKIGQRHGYDYVSNTDERFRTSIDGLDAEYMSTKLLQWCAEHAQAEYDREHVTPMMRRQPPSWAKMGTVLNYLDLSDIKLSVDTQEDLDYVNSVFHSALNKYQAALKVYGHTGVHRL